MPLKYASNFLLPSLILLATSFAATHAADAPPAPQPTAAPAAPDVQQLAKQARESIVVITVTGRDDKQQGLGSGFVVSADGLIATNLHVIGEGRKIAVQTSAGDKLEVLGIHATERSRDLAVLRVKADNLPALELADSDKLADGQPVVALGNPQGLNYSVVAGVVSGTREIEGRKMIQLAMPVEPGNSGGPVLDAEGRVVGIVTMKSRVTDNLGFAGAVNDLKLLLDKPNPVPIERWLTIGALDPRRWEALGGARWQQRAGRVLVDGAGAGFGGRSQCLARIPPPELPYEVAVTVKLGDEAGAAGLAFLADGGEQHYGFYASNGRLRLSRFDGPDVLNWKVLDEKPSAAYRRDGWNRLRVRVEKDKLQCFVNEQLVMESTDRELTSGRVGLVKFRETQAEFKHFACGKDLTETRVTAEQAAQIAAAIERLPPLIELQPTALSDLTLAPAASVEMLRQRAADLQRHSESLRRIASDVHTQAVVAELVKLATPADDKPFDLLRAALQVARLDEEDVDVEAYVEQVDGMAEELRAKLPESADQATIIAALNQYLFIDNGIHGSRTDYYNRANSYLNRVIDDREGLPITLSVLYIELGRRLGLNVQGVGLPGQFIVQVVPKEGEPQLVDPFEGGILLTRAEAEQRVREYTGAEPVAEVFQAATGQQILQRMLANLLGVAQSSGDKEAMLRYLEAIVALDPKRVRERGLRAIVRFETGRKASAASELDWFLENQPEGIDLEQIRRMQQFFRESDGP